MLQFKKIPYATIALSISMIMIYWMLSADTPYITDENLGDFALSSNNPLSFLSHLFIHVGIFHLIGNILPLILFGLVLESAIISIDVLIIFLLAGTISSFLFSLMNPGIPLIGASAGISGILAAVMLVKPKAALALLIATPLLISLAFFPAANFISHYYEENMVEKKVVLETQLERAIKTNQSVQVISQINKTIQKTDEKIEVTFSGRVREEATPTDFLVHVYGAIIGGFYIYFLRRQKLKDAEGEFVHIGSYIFHALDWMDSKIKGNRKK